MTSVAYVEERIQWVMNEEARIRARETGCVKRERKFDGASLLQTLVFGFLSHPHASLEALASMATVCDVFVSDTAIDKRFNRACAEFLVQILEDLSSLVVSAQEPVPTKLLLRFSSVELQDSSVLTLPDEFKELWRGIGSPHGKAEAAMKAHVRWDLLHGGLKGPKLTSGRTSDKDNAWLDEEVEANSLEITDLGYLDIKRIARRRKAHAYSLTRYRVDVGQNIRPRPTDCHRTCCSSQGWAGQRNVGSRGSQAQGSHETANGACPQRSGRSTPTAYRTGGTGSPTRDQSAHLGVDSLDNPAD